MASKKKKPGGGLVWDSDQGRTCPGCERAVADCVCDDAGGGGDGGGGPARLSYETKGRKGKGVTVVADLGLGAVALGLLAKELKAVCGSGGTVEDGRVLIQGDHRDRVEALLRAKGHAVRRVGG
ncbi:MAG: stress response translation initiation inhibitor YciH [Planctomycetota bacterium]